MLVPKNEDLNLVDLIDGISTRYFEWLLNLGLNQGRSQHGARGGNCPPPILGVAPPIGSCPGHSRKPAFGNGAIASWEMYKD